MYTAQDLKSEFFYFVLQCCRPEQGWSHRSGGVQAHARHGLGLKGSMSQKGKGSQNQP